MWKQELQQIDRRKKMGKHKNEIFSISIRNYEKLLSHYSMKI